MVGMDSSPCYQIFTKEFVGRVQETKYSTIVPTAMCTKNSRGYGAQADTVAWNKRDEVFMSELSAEHVLSVITTAVGQRRFRQRLLCRRSATCCPRAWVHEKPL